MTKKKIAFGWYGGKYSHLNFILPLLPTCHHYVEPFGGSAAVLLNRKPSHLETYNDIDGELVNFFNVLRNEPQELIWRIDTTPHSRQEFAEAHNPTNDKLERARRFYIRAQQSRYGLGSKSIPSNWSYCIKDFNCGMSTSVAKFRNSVRNLEATAERLLTVQIENLPGEEIIRRYDSVDTLFYCDPPYPHESRNAKCAYSFEMTDVQHRKLANMLNTCRGRVALSSYDCGLVRELYEGWYFTLAPEKSKPSSGTRNTAQELLITNYDPGKIDIVEPTGQAVLNEVMT